MATDAHQIFVYLTMDLLNILPNFSVEKQAKHSFHIPVFRNIVKLLKDLCELHIRKYFCKLETYPADFRLGDLYLLLLLGEYFTLNGSALVLRYNIHNMYMHIYHTPEAWHNIYLKYKKEFKSNVLQENTNTHCCLNILLFYTSD